MTRSELPRTVGPAIPVDDRIRTGPTGLVLRWILTDQGRGFVALRNGPFRFLYVGFVAQQLGFWTSHLTLQGLTEQISGGDTFAVSVLFAALFAPAVVVGPMGGVMADRIDRRKLIIFGYSAMAVVAIMLAVVVTVTDDPPLSVVYALALVLGTTFSLTNPALGAGVANSVRRDDLQSAIAMQAAAANVTRVAGPVIAAPIIAAGRFNLGFVTFALTCLFGVSVMSRSRLAPFVPDPDDPGVLTRFVDGFRHARERPPALRAITTVAVTSVFGVAHVALIPSFASEVLDRDPGLFAWIVAATGCGAVVGALTVGYSRVPVTLASAGRHQAMYGAAMIAFAASETLVWAAAAQVVAGFYYFTSMTRLQTLVQQAVDEPKRARVMSLFTLAWAGIVWIGALGLGVSADLLDLGVRPTLVGAATIVITHGVLLAGRHRAVSPGRH